MNATAPRRDSLPEFTAYVDTGCSLSPSCLECPLIRCRYDDSIRVTSVRRQGGGAEIARLHAEGLTFGEIAARLGVSLRTVMRTAARERSV